MRDALLWLLFVGPPVVVAIIWRIDYKRLEAKYHELGSLSVKVAEERLSLKKQVRELEGSLETVTRQRDALKTEVTYLGWDLETAQQLHKIAEFKLEQQRRRVAKRCNAF